MTETIKVEVDEALARRFRKKAMETYGYKKGSMKKALEQSMRDFSSPRAAVDWGSVRGIIKVRAKKSSTDLQHEAWARVD